MIPHQRPFVASKQRLRTFCFFNDHGLTECTAHALRQVPANRIMGPKVWSGLRGLGEDEKRRGQLAEAGTAADPANLF